MIDGRRGRTPNEGAAEKETGTVPHGSAPAARDERSELVERSPSRDRFGRLALGQRLAAHGVSADHVTVVGLLLAAATGTVIALGHLWTGVALVTVGGLMDTLDGAVAKAAGTSSRRGAFLDSVSDRVADAFMFGGLAWYIAARHHPELALLPFAILAVGNVISYERAKAESFGWEAKGGLMERAERLIGLAVAMAFNIVLVPLLWTLLALCVVTAGQRFVKIWRQATAELTGEPLQSHTGIRSTTAGAALAAWRPARVESRWRAWREARVSGSAERHAPLTPRSSRSRRRAGEPLSTRLRSVLATERTWGDHRTATTATARRAQRRQEGAAAALRRRLGTGR